MPSGRFGANAAWLTLNVIAHNLSRWTARIGGLDVPNPADHDENEPAARGQCQSFVATETVRRRYLAIPGRMATSARKSFLHLPTAWPWATGFNDMLAAIRNIQLAT